MARAARAIGHSTEFVAAALMLGVAAGALELAGALRHFGVARSGERVRRQGETIGSDRIVTAFTAQRHGAGQRSVALRASQVDARVGGRHPTRRKRLARANRVKQDAVPGLTIPIWFVPNVTTAEMRSRLGKPEFQYEIACAQLCGLGHARMRGFVTVTTGEEFQKWLDERIKESAELDIFR